MNLVEFNFKLDCIHKRMQLKMLTLFHNYDFRI